MQEIGGDAAGRVGAQPAQRIVRHRGQRGRAHRDGEKPVLQVVGEAARAIGGQIAPQVVRETDPGDRRVLVEAVAAVALRGSRRRPGIALIARRPLADLARIGERLKRRTDYLPMSPSRGAGSVAFTAA